MRRLSLSVLVVALVALLAGCGGREDTNELTPPTQETEIIEETQEQAGREAMEQAPRGQRGAPGDQLQDMPAANGGDLTEEEKCQLNKAVADVGEDGAIRLLQDWALSSMKADSPDANFGEALEDISQAQSFSAFLEEQGYSCKPW